MTLQADVSLHHLFFFPERGGGGSQVRPGRRDAVRAGPSPRHTVTSSTPHQSSEGIGTHRDADEETEAELRRSDARGVERDVS